MDEETTEPTQAPTEEDKHHVYIGFDGLGSMSVELTGMSAAMLHAAAGYLEFKANQSYAMLELADAQKAGGLVLPFGGRTKGH